MAYFRQKGISAELEAAYFEAVYKQLEKGILTGLNYSVNAYEAEHFFLTQQLLHNAATFSAFKKHAFQSQLTELLVNTDTNEVRPWAEFWKTAQKISEKTNKRHLKIEYDTAIASANMADKWADIQKRKHLYPMLRYDAVNDERTRESHRNWDGLNLPVDHVFWKSHYPPNDWGCRCTVIPNDEAEDTKKTDVNDVPELPAQFNNNVGVNNQIFTKEHPYYDINNQDTHNQLMQEVADFKIRIPQYLNSGTSRVKISRWADSVDLINNLRVSKLLANKLNISLKIRPDVQGYKSGMGSKGASNPELIINGDIGDIKHLREDNLNGNIANSLNKARLQGCSTCVIELRPFHEFNKVVADATKKMSDGRRPEIKIIIIIQGEKIKVVKHQ